MKRGGEGGSSAPRHCGEGEMDGDMRGDEESGESRGGATPHACESRRGIRNKMPRISRDTEVMRSPAALHSIAVAIRDGQLVP